MSTCPHCGYVNPPGSAFCAQCRHAFTPPPARRPVNVPAPQPVRGYVQCPQCRTWSTEAEPTCIQCGHDFRLRYAPPVQPFRHEAPRVPPDVITLLAFGFAVVGFWFLPCLFGPVAFILGLVAYHHARPEHRWMANVALVVGLISVMLAGWSVYQISKELEEPLPQTQPAPMPDTGQYFPAPR